MNKLGGKEIIENKFKAQKNFNSELIKEIFTDIGIKSDENKVIQDILYASIRNFFDIGFELAKDLNFELLHEQFKSLNKNKKEK
ncbi:MAG: hypothetical protein ACTSQJ_02690 [Promethearchaeota archaeon]